VTVYESRWEFIRPHVENKRVLDIGPAELVGTVNREKLERWIFGKIEKVASHSIGLENNTEQVEVLSDMGFNIRQGDAEDFALGEKFDVLVAGELIEHLSNPGKFLDHVRKHLLLDGKLLLTTPNRYSILTIFHVIMTGKVPAYRKPIAKHVAFFDEDAISSLLRRHGLAKIRIDYCKWVGAPSGRRRDMWLVELVSRYRPVLLPVLLVTASI